MNILVIHSHNANRGDEAAVKSMVAELISKYPDVNIYISNNGFTPYPNMPKNVIQISRFPKLRSRVAQLEFFLILSTRGKFVFSEEAKTFLNILKNTDLVIHAPGGPSIGDTYFKAEKVYLWRLEFIRKLGIPYMFYAPSMGPFNVNKRKKNRSRVLKGAKRILLRDPISVKYLKEFIPDIKVEQALDSALQFDINQAENETKFINYPELDKFLKEYPKSIGITITDLKWHPVHKSEKIIENISSVFNAFIEQKINEGYGIIFIPQLYGSSNDTQIMQEYMRDRGTFLVDATSQERDAFFQQYIIGKLYAVVGMRYHSNIFSAKMGTPFVSISYEQKMSGFMQYVGIEDYCIDLYDLSKADLINVFSELENHHDEYKAKLLEMHVDMQQKAYRSTQAVIDILEGNM